MSFTLSEANPWSSRRWCWIVVLIVGFQILSVLLLSNKPADLPIPRYATPQGVRLVSGVDQSAVLREILMLKDPTMFVLAHPNGFSGSAWLRLSPIAYPVTNEIEPSEALTNDQWSLASDFARRVEGYLMRPSSVVEKQSPEIIFATSKRKPLSIQTSFRVDGNLAERSLAFVPELPAPEPDKAASNCIVHVVVNSSGEVISAVAWPPTGFDSLDRKAIEFAKAARFTPLNQTGSPSSDGTLTFGKFVMQWIIGDAESSAQAGEIKP